ncbi:MAG TPA: hypothetical protein VME86_04755 [Acidobacteriaceae bacterium]|nr:hypothetical protein [Acidobacteriaceae bacterium]
MKLNGTRWAVACLSLAIIASPVAFAQQQQQNNDSQYEGVSHPPPNDTIVATPEQPYSTAPTSAAKPSPEVTAPPPPATTPAAHTTAPAYTAPAYSSGSSYSASNNSLSSQSRYDNTDYGIVTVPVTPQEVNQEFPKNTPSLETRPNYNADNDIVTSVPGSAYALPEGTEIRVRLDNALSTNYTTEETPFQGRVMVDVLNGGSVIIPAGSVLRGRVTEVAQGHHFGPAATLRLRPDEVILPDGTAYHLYAQVIDSEAPGTRTGGEGGIQPNAHIVKKSLEYGVGVGTGALVGAELAGPAGALAGSLIGAGLVTTHLLTQHPTAASVPVGSEIVFSLTEPMDLTPTRN